MSTKVTTSGLGSGVPASQGSAETHGGALNECAEKVSGLFAWFPAFPTNAPVEFPKNHQVTEGGARLALSKSEQLLQLQLIGKMEDAAKLSSGQKACFWAKDVAINLGSEAGGDLLCAVRRVFQDISMAFPFADSIANLLANGAIGASFTQGMDQIWTGTDTVRAAWSVRDFEGVEIGCNGILQGVFSIISGLLWALTTWIAAFAATLVGAAIATIVVPLVSAVALLLKCVLAIKRVIDLHKFNTKFLECFNKNGQGEDVVDEKKMKDFIADCLLIGPEEEERIQKEADVMTKEWLFATGKYPELQREKGGITGPDVSLKEFDGHVDIMKPEVVEKLRKDALSRQKAYLERRLNPECYSLMLSYLKGELANASDAVNPAGAVPVEKIALEQVRQKITDTIWWNRFVLGVRIAITIAGIAALIALAIFPCGYLAIFLVLTITTICWVILDIRGSALWPKIRHALTDEDACLGKLGDPLIKHRRLTKFGWAVVDSE